MEEVSQFSEERMKLFNTPLEVGLRALVLLNHWKDSMDVEKLMYLDYLSLNTDDVGGPDSIHAPLPNRSVQAFARKTILQKGIAFLISKELIDFHASSSGFQYSINKSGERFLEYFSSTYFKEYSECAGWITNKFKRHTTDDIRKIIDNNLTRWGSEFLDQSADFEL